MIRPLVRHTRNMALIFAAMVFGVTLLSVMLIAFSTVFLLEIGVLTRNNVANFGIFLICMGLISAAVGGSLALFISHIPLNPVNMVMHGMDALAKGNFSTRLDLGSSVIGRDVADSFNQMAAELEGTEILRADFVNNFSHEFKTPIVSIQGFAELMRYAELSEDERNEYLDTIVSESKRLAELATNILTLSKLENQNIVAEKTVYNLAEQLRTVLLTLEPKWSAKCIDMQINLEECSFHGNEDLVRHIWTNIIGNAIKFSNTGGEIKVSLTQSPTEICCLVQDNGCGMDARTRAHIFERFYQGDASHSTDGSGVGLSIVKRVIELCDGSVAVESGKGKGSAFTVRLPNDNIS